MKKILAFVLVCVCVAAPSVFGQTSSFEGVINMEMTSHGQKVPIVESIKGSLTRQDMTMGMMSMVTIKDATGKKMTMLMPAMKGYKTMDIPDMKSAAADSMTKPVKTGKTETILGHACDEWTWTDVKMKTTFSLWMAKGLGLPAMQSGGQMDRMMGGASSAFEAMAKDGDLYPLRTVAKDASGNVLFQMDVTKIEAKSVDASLFQVPTDYKEMNMPGMGGMGRTSDR